MKNNISNIKWWIEYIIAIILYGLSIFIFNM